MGHHNNTGGDVDGIRKEVIHYGKSTIGGVIKRRSTLAVTAMPPAAERSIKQCARMLSPSNNDKGVHAYVQTDEREEDGHACGYEADWHHEKFIHDIIEV